MKTYKYQCEECNSENVEGLMWVALNEPIQVDNYSMHSGDSNGLWCNA